MERLWSYWYTLCAIIILCFQHAATIELQLDSADSIKAASKVIATDMMKYYTEFCCDRPGSIPGLLPSPYYWWEAGAMFGQMVEYWGYTGDETWNDITTQALLWQIGEKEDFAPSNQSFDLGNDDQVFWAFAAMTAAELNYPDPPPDKPGWLALCQAVFNEQAARWDMTSCGGGLHWQVFPLNRGWDYKNTISTGGFFQLAARLARYTANDTYAEWATKAYDWISDSLLLQKDNWQINDGMSSAKNCSDVSHDQWTYNYGVIMLGAAYMYNYTRDSTWSSRVQNIWNASHIFFLNDSIMAEAACEPYSICKTDQFSFKAYLARWMASTLILVPQMRDQIVPYLKSSAIAAAAQCTGPPAGTTCGTRWTVDGYDGITGVGQEMSALSIVQSNLAYMGSVRPPLTNETGGSSRGNPAAGNVDDANDLVPPGYDDITKTDRAGAAVLTAFLVAFTLGIGIWMSR